MPYFDRSVLFLLLLAVSAGIVFGCSSSAEEPDSRHSHSHAEPGEEASVYPDRITLTWAQDPTSSLSVSWRTDSTVTTPKAQIAPAKAEPSFYKKARTVEATTHPLDFPGVPSDSVDGPYQYHSVTFEGLGADSTYAYRVGDGTHWSEWFHAETASAEPAPFSFLYLGDAQNNLRSHWSRAIRAAYTEAPDAAFAVHSGDLVNLPHRNVEWGRWHQAGDWIQSMVPTVPVPGNHEYGSYGESWELFTGSTGVEGPEASSGLSVHWRPQFALPKNGPKGLKETVYFLDHQGLRLIGLNTMAAKKDSTMLRRQTEWLETVLQNAESRWIVVTLHHPLFASAVDRENPDLRKAWRPLLAKYGVDLVLQGHDHTYARGRSENLTQGVNARPSGGPVYVNSVSGAKMYPLKDDRWAEYEGIDLERGGENTQLYQVVRVGRDTMRYRSYTVTGDRYDAFDLVRRDGGAPNEMIQRMPGDAGERTHENTIPYERP